MEQAIGDLIGAGDDGGRLADDAQVLPSADRQDLTAYDPDTGELRFDRPAAELDLAVGDVVVSEPKWTICFKEAQKFNQNLSGWDVSNVPSCTDFDQGVDAWQEEYKPEFE